MMFTRSYSKVRQLAEILFYVLICVLLLSLMSQVSIPLHPIPITLQTVAVMIIGLKFSRRVALSAVSTYLLLGAIGCPVFPGFSSGSQVLFGPSCGYLLGFVAAVVVMSYVNELSRCRLLVRNSLSCLAGTVTIFIFGVSWLATEIGIKQAITVGILPFIVPGIIKIFLLISILHYLDYRKK